MWEYVWPIRMARLIDYMHAYKDQKNDIIQNTDLVNNSCGCKLGLFSLDHRHRSTVGAGLYICTKDATLVH